MPFVRIDLAKGKTAGHRKAIGEIVYKAMTETINVPKDDKFQVITEHEPDDLNFPESYLGITYSKDIVFIQITLNAGAHGRHEEDVLQAHRRRSSRPAQDPPRRRHHQSGGGGQGELVVREWYRPVRLTCTSVPNPKFVRACGFTWKNFKSAALVWFRFRSSLEGLAGKIGRTSEPTD